MGTNYFAVTKVSEGTKQQIKEAIDADNFGLAKSLMPKSIHLGKSSGGWQFLFNHHNWEYFDASSMITFINACKIFDEYGHELSANQFWVMVDRKAGLKPELEYGHMVGKYCFSNYTEFS